MATNMKSPKTYLLMFSKVTGDQVCDEGHLLKIDDSAQCIAEESELKKNAWTMLSLIYQVLKQHCG